MFFSIIIPTYNPNEYLPTLLTSISKNECIDDIEIIISDDCSTKPFNEIVNSFGNLRINQISNDKHYGFPRNGRQHGAEVATGKWITFADQDDYFLDNAFDKIKTFIEENEAENYLVSDFIIETVSSGKYTICDGKKGWTHGKFYEKSFWDKYNLGYDEIDHCEDINLSTKVSCIMSIENIIGYQFTEPIYVWHRRNDSLCDTQYFIEGMPDYERCTIGVIMDYMEKYKDDEKILGELNVKFITALYHTYFYFQTDLLKYNKKMLFETLAVLHPIFDRYKKLTQCTVNDIIRVTNEDLRNLYSEIRNGDYQQVPFLESMTFIDWMKAYF